MPRTITVISKRRCHICDDVMATVVNSSPGVEVKVLHIDDDTALHDKYWLTVPVVLVDGEQVFDANQIGGGRDYLKRLEALLKGPSA